MDSWRTVVAGMLIFGLGAALVWVVLFQEEVPSAPAPTLANAPGPRSSTVTSATVTIPTSTTTSTTAISVTTQTPATLSVVVAMQEALTAWGWFAVTGEMADLGDHFVVGGPQRRLLREESTALRQSPPGPPPYEVTASNVFSISVATDDVVLRANVAWARKGEETQEFVWDIQMRQVDGQWRLVTVADATPG